jgi:predicted aconitase
MSRKELHLNAEDRKMLMGERGPGPRFAMELIVRTAEISNATRLIDINWAHVASAYYNGQVNVDFAERLASSGTRVAVPTTLTSCSHDVRLAGQNGDTASVQTALRVIELYREMGCQTVMTCAPYHTRAEPVFGQHVAWTESSAVVYANSVLGARTNRYDEFLDMCAAITGRVPDAGLHRTRNRRAAILCNLREVPEPWLLDDRFYHVLGYFIGRIAGTDIPAINGLPRTVKTEQLRALGTAAAVSGSVSMFHTIGVSPEAATYEEAFHGESPDRIVNIGPDELRAAAGMLETADARPFSAVCVGAPHFSIDEFEQLIPLIEGVAIKPDIHFYIATSRHVLEDIRERGWLDMLKTSGVEIVTDRCTYYAPIIEGCDGRVMTASAKWAYYAPGNLGSSVTFASLEDCVQSAVAGRIMLTSNF